MSDLALSLARWAVALQPTREDLELADRALLDTLAVSVAGREEPVARFARELSEGGCWGAIGHALDYDDVHLPSTSHISVVCVAAALASGGGARAYLAGAGVMARLGVGLGWSHYGRGWHTTCTAGAPAAAVAAGVAAGFDAERLATAIALAVPGAGGVQNAFGTDAKPLQVGFAVETGLRAARAASAGAGAATAAVDQWFALLGGSAAAIELRGPAVPDGLAIKLYPCCYAMHRPIGATRQLGRIDVADVDSLTVEAFESAVLPLRHARPSSGLEGKFSLEYAVATALIDGHPGIDSFTDEAVSRPNVRHLLERTDLVRKPGGDGVFDGTVRVSVRTKGGRVDEEELILPPGHPRTPPTADELAAKVRDCAGPDLTDAVIGASWATAPDLLRHALG